MVRLLLLSVVFVPGRASRIVYPAHLRGNMPTTTMKFFGPQRFSFNTSGHELVALKGVHEKVDVFGKVLLYNYKAYDAEKNYLTLESRGALAILSPSQLPGLNFYVHNGERGKRTSKKSLLLLDTHSASWDLLSKHITQISLILEPNHNHVVSAANHWISVM